MRGSRQAVGFKVKGFAWGVGQRRALAALPGCWAAAGRDGWGCTALLPPRHARHPQQRPSAAGNKGAQSS